MLNPHTTAAQPDVRQIVLSRTFLCKNVLHCTEMWFYHPDRCLHDVRQTLLYTLEGWSRYLVPQIVHKIVLDVHNLIALLGMILCRKVWKLQGPRLA